MKKTTLLESVTFPDGSVLSLHEHDGSYVLRVDGRELMSTRRHASEYRLGEVGCAPFSQKRGARVLIGGLGLGFTLRAALKTLRADAEVVLAELMPEVVAWNRNPAYGLAGAELDDPRTRLAMGDVYALIARSQQEFDAIMLDADNDTTAMMTEGNRRLFQSSGLAKVHAALRAGGCAVYWSAAQEPELAELMQRTGFTVRVERMRSAGTSGGLHTLVIGRKR